MTIHDGEFDELDIQDDRPRHPYVAEHPDEDLSAREWIYESGETCSVEFQAWSSRTAFHAIEALKGMLTPRGALYAIQMLLHHLTPAALGESVEGFEGWPAGSLEGPMLATVDCERLFGERLGEALAIIDDVLERCPSCGRKHGEVGYVHTQTGRSVQVIRVEGGTVWFRREFQPGEWTAPESMPKDAFDRYHVPSDDVALLGVDRDAE